MKPTKSLAVEATVYWIAILVILIGGEFIAVLLNATPASTMGPQAPVIAIVWAVIGYFCWRLKRWAFLLAAVAMPVGILGTYITLHPATLYDFLSREAYRILPHLFVIFYSYRAYRDLAPGESQKTQAQ